MIDITQLDIVKVTYEDFKAALQADNPTKCVILMTQFINNDETYYSPNMLARVIGLKKIHDEGSEFEFLEVETDFAEFEFHNDEHDEPNWHGIRERSGESGLTAKESGWFPKTRRETVYLNKSVFDDEPNFVKVMNEDFVAPDEEVKAMLLARIKEIFVSEGKTGTANLLEKEKSAFELVVDSYAMDIFKRGAGSPYKNMENLIRRYMLNCDNQERKERDPSLYEQ